jgi:hypothetical protein
MAAPKLRSDRGVGQRVGTLLLVGGLAYLFAALAAGVEQSLREVLLRYAFVAAAVFAIAPPHLLLPDRSVRWLQLLNPSPRALLGRQGRVWGFVVAAFLVPPAVLAMDVGGAWVGPLVEVVFVVLGVGLYAFDHYTAIGPVSQAWQEGRKGERYRKLIARDERADMRIPHGLVPTVLASARIFAIAAATILATALLVSFVGEGLGLIPPLVLLGVAMRKLARRVPRYDHDFYCTNALYIELLMRGGPREAQREPVAYDAVYWTPSALRPHVWAGLRQLDRRLPLGRLFALGVLGLWALFIRDASAGVVAGYLLIALGAKNGAVALLAAEPLAPRPFDLALQRPMGWIATRFFVNLRWTLPLALALALVALFDAGFTLADMALWVGVDLALAFLTAWLATYAAEVRYRRRFA